MPDAAAVLSSLAARLGRQPDLSELLAELGVSPSGTPSTPPPGGSGLDGATPDHELTRLVRMQDLQRQGALPAPDASDQLRSLLGGLIQPLLPWLFGGPSTPEMAPFVPNGVASAAGHATGSAPGRSV